MTPKVYIYGINGNMGRRYSAVCRHLGVDFDGCDIGRDSADPVASFTHRIIATPTMNHLTLINQIRNCGVSVLCEKPFINDARDMDYLESSMLMAKSVGMKLSMVSQYDFFGDFCGAYFGAPWDGTEYDFYQSGRDGLPWDCINIIWHARGKISLKNESPIWRCIINGEHLEIGRMDEAYVDMIDSWIRNKEYYPEYQLIVDKHKRVLDYIDGKFNLGTDSDTSKKLLNTFTA